MRPDNLYVSDFGNNRVLEYNAPLTSGDVANLVFGQLGSFTTGDVQQRAVSVPARYALRRAWRSTRAAMFISPTPPITGFCGTSRR